MCSHADPGGKNNHAPKISQMGPNGEIGGGLQCLMMFFIFDHVGLLEKHQMHSNASNAKKKTLVGRWSVVSWARLVTNGIPLRDS